MIDPEISRLRRLRAMALRVRAIARTLSSKRYAQNDLLLERAAGASWRIARAASGRLRSHPFASFQRDAGVAENFWNQLFAAALALGSRSREQALAKFERHLAALARQLDDARALTWSSDLSDSLGRSQIELRGLLEALARETPGSCASLPMPQGCVAAASGAGNFANPVAGDWPYLAL